MPGREALPRTQLGSYRKVSRAVAASLGPGRDVPGGSRVLRSPPGEVEEAHRQAPGTRDSDVLIKHKEGAPW